MKNVTISRKRQSREYMSNPHTNKELDSRLNESNCTFYDYDIEIRDIGYGYGQIVLKREHG